MYKLLIFTVVALLAVESWAQNRKPVAVPIQNVPTTASTTTTAPKSSEAAPSSTNMPTTAEPTSTTIAKQTGFSLVVEECQRDCIVTPEYNPVCGSNNVMYANPGRLLCAQMCGVDVTLVNYGRCQEKQ